MTPLGFTEELAADLATRGAPQPAHGQLGEVVLACAGTIVSILTHTEIDLGGNCGVIELVDVVATITRDCANVAYEDGTTNWAAQDRVSVLLDADATLLWEWGEKLRAAAWYRGQPPALVYSQLGGVANVTLSIQLPLP
jgi:hypothetical protein